MSETSVSTYTVLLIRSECFSKKDRSVLILMNILLYTSTCVYLYYQRYTGYCSSLLGHGIYIYMCVCGGLVGMWVGHKAAI